MSRGKLLAVSLVFTLVATLVVILIAGYSDSLMSLGAMMPMIAGPIMLPFLILTFRRYTSLTAWIAIAASLTIGWGFVAYVDSRPYEGGGASFAILFGWFASALTILLAGIIAIVGSERFHEQTSEINPEREG